MEPREGLLTYRAEGNNVSNSRYYSRKIHWPGMASRCNKYGSGVTIGRGYDMKERSPTQIIHHLTLAGIPIEKAKKIAEGSKKSFCSASDFVKEKRETIDEITEGQQVRLFEIVYKEYILDSIRFYNRYKDYKSVTWDKLDQEIKDVFIDMKYQGVLTKKMVPDFGRNEKAAIINLIKSSPILLRDEMARQRIKHLEGKSK